MTTTFNIPKMKINKFRQILDLPQIDKLEVPLLDTTINMAIHIDESEVKPVTYFLFHSSFMVYGWTTNSGEAFTAKGNASIYTAGELYDLMRGKKI